MGYHLELSNVHRMGRQCRSKFCLQNSTRKCGDQDLYVELISSVMFVKFGVYTINYICKEQHYMHWTLDYDRKSDTKDMVGYWRVEQIKTNPPVTRVDYATEMLVTGVCQLSTDLSMVQSGSSERRRRLPNKGVSYCESATRL